MVNISLLFFLFFLEKVMHLDLVALTVNLQFVQDPLTVSNKDAEGETRTRNLWITNPVL